MYAKDPNEAKYQYLIRLCEKVGIDHLDEAKALIEYSDDMHNVYKNIDEYNPDPKNKKLIVFNDMITEMINKRRLVSTVTELFIKGRKLSVSLAFITQSHFKVPQDVRINTTHFFIAKIMSKRELQRIVINHSSDISTKDFINIYRECTYSPLGKAFEKQVKTIEDQGQKQVKALNTLKSNRKLTIEDVITKNVLNNDKAEKELEKIKEIEKM